MSEALKEAPNAEATPRVASAAVTMDGHYLPPPVSKKGQTWVRTSVLVQATAEQCYAQWRDLPGIPGWQEFITDVRETGPQTSHWVMVVNGKAMEWDSQILKDEPGERIAWRSLGGDLQEAGEVIFEPAPAGRGTLITVLQEFGVGNLSAMAATVAARNPRQAVIENLRHFKALMETGEIPRIEGQPHGPRGVSGKLKSHLYGENVETPAGLERRAS